MYPQASVVHRCLNMAEIMQNILDNVEEKGSLLPLSLVCRAFFEPIMDGVWRNLDSPRPLILLFPEEIRGKPPSEHLSLIAAPSKADWSRFNMYACRVRTLVYSQVACFIRAVVGNNAKASDTWHVINWESFMRYLPDRPLLPNLQTFESDYELPLYIRPPLRHLRLRFWKMGPAKEVMQALHQCAQTLETLKITVADWDTINPQATLRLSRAITEMQVLTTVDVEKLLPPALEHLCSLRTLRELHFAIDRIDIATTPLPFPALERIKLKAHVADAALMVSVLHQLQAPGLREMTIAFHVNEPAGVQRGLRTAVRPTAAYAHAVLGAASAHTQLRAFEFAEHATYTIVDRPLAVPPECTLDLRTLAPLLALHALERVELPDTPVSLARGDTAQLAQAWSHARIVRLGDQAPGAHGHVPLRELLPFARGCPRLETLGLPLCIDGADPDATRAAAVRFRGEAPSGAPLKLLQTPCGVTAFGTETVEFLGSVFPHAALRSSAALGETSVVRRISTLKEAFLRTLAAQAS